MGARVDFERVLLAGPLFKMRTRARAETLERDECRSFVSFADCFFLSSNLSSVDPTKKIDSPSIEPKIRFNERVNNS